MFHGKHHTGPIRAALIRLPEGRPPGSIDPVNAHVRAARPGDEVGIQANCKTAATVEQVREQVGCTTAGHRFRGFAHFVAEHEGAVVGNVMLLPVGSHLVRGQDGLVYCPGPQGGRPLVGRLDDYVVASRLWRRGIGTRLTERVVQEARRCGLVRLETSSANPAAVAAFQRQGFRQHGSLPLPPGTPPQWHGGSTEVLFHMDLTS
jgi:GNAT superfamily N-acetyltransferase